jgi:Matrixin
MKVKCVLLSALIAFAIAPCNAYEVVPAHVPNEYLKWGPSHVAGTPGDVVTWGFVAAGTPGSAACATYCPGESSDSLPHFYPAPEHSNFSAAITLLDLQPAFQAAFEAWSNVADVRFQYVGVDDSLRPINNPTATEPMIRIGIYSFDGLWAYCTAAETFAPPTNVGTVAGDIFLNRNVGYQWSNAPEGAELSPFPVGGGLYMTDVYVLALHEIGHAIGLGDSSSSDCVMNGGDPASATLRSVYVSRNPKADDIAGAQFLYGLPKKPERHRDSRRLAPVGADAILTHRVKFRSASTRGHARLGRDGLSRTAC